MKKMTYIWQDRKRTFLGIAVMAVAVAISFIAMEYDWLGIESWTPEVNQVESVTIGDSRNNYSFYGDISTVVEDPADIQRIIDAHKDIYSRMGDEAYKRHQVRLEYKLKSGRKVIRYYYAPAVGEGYAIVQSYLYNSENILGFTDPVDAAARVENMDSSFGDIPPALYEKVLVALRNECNNGKVSLYDKGEYYLEYCIVDDQGDALYRSLMIDGSATELTQLLTGPEAIMGYSDWAEFVKTVQKFTLSDKELSHKLSQDVKEDLLMAIRKDIEAGCDLGGRWVDSYDYVVSYYVPYPSGRTEYRELYITAKAQYTMAWLAANGYIPSETPHT